MRIFTEQPLVEYIDKYPETKTALQEWASVAKKSQWTSFADVKESFADATSIGSSSMSSTSSATATSSLPSSCSRSS